MNRTDTITAAAAHPPPPQRRVVQPAFRNENPGATQPQKSQARVVEYQRAHPDAHRIGIPPHPGRVDRAGRAGEDPNESDLAQGCRNARP
jgi:hypothetical protein